MSRLHFFWAGDSITEGFGDGGAMVSCYGVPGRFLRASIDNTSVATTLHTSVAVSGRRVDQYTEVAKAVIAADPTRVSAVLCSIWSPNFPTGEEGGLWPTRPENLAAMRATLQAFEQWLLDRSIVFLPTFMAGTALFMGPERRQNLQAHLDACEELWPWLLDLNTPIQDPAITDGPSLLIPTYSTDATHPNDDGYEAMYQWAAPRLMPAFEEACTHYGFVEA